VKTVVPFLSDGVESEVHFLKVGQPTQFLGSGLQSLDEVESGREDSEVGGKVVQNSDLVVVDEEFFKAFAVGVVEEAEVFEVVVLQRQFF
jgi:hypothetical protein